MAVYDHEEFRAKGYCVLSEFLTNGRLEQMQIHVDRVLSMTSTDVNQEWIMNIHLLGEDWLMKLALDEQLIGIVKHQCGSEIALLQTQLFCKAPGAQGTPFHQDASDASDSSLRMATVWIALDDIDASNGGLIVFPGQHLHGKILPNHKGQHYQFDRVLSDDFLNQCTSVQYEMKAGQAALHHPLLPHGSQPNRSTAVRRVIVLRYIDANVLRQAQVPLWTVAESNTFQFVSGSIDQDQDLYQHFQNGTQFFPGKCILL